MIKYSFIIPHRNTPVLLQRLLDSIPQRDDIEIIIVDDNSDSNVVNFDSFPGKDRNSTRIIYCRDSGRGAGHARNLGLEVASGEWLLFADADDYYDNTNLNLLLNKFQNDSTTDIVYLNAQLFDETGCCKPHPIDQLMKNYLAEQYYSEMYLRYSVWTPWTRMVRHKIVTEKNLKFEEVPAANDKNFCLRCSQYAKIIAVETNLIYNYYRPHSQSQTDKKRNSKGLDAMILVRTHSNQIYDEVGYKHKLSYFTLFHKSIYAQDIPFVSRYKKYFKTLKINNVNLLTDVYRYYIGVLTRKDH